MSSGGVEPTWGSLSLREQVNDNLNSDETSFFNFTLLVHPRNPPGPPAVENVPPPVQNMVPAGAEAAAAEVVDFPIDNALNDTITLSDDEEVRFEH